MHEFFRCLGNVPGQVEFLGKNVRGAAREKSERDAVAVVMAGETVNDFVERAVAPAGDDEATVFFGGARGDLGGVAGTGGFGEVGVNAACGENVARLIEQVVTAAAAVAGVRVVDHQRVLQVSSHMCAWAVPIEFETLGKTFILYNSRRFWRIVFQERCKKKSKADSSLRSE